MRCSGSNTSFDLRLFIKVDVKENLRSEKQIEFVSKSIVSRSTRRFIDELLPLQLYLI